IILIFSYEEDVMRKYEYNDLENHKIEHEAFIKKLSDIRKEYETAGANLTVIINANQFILDWLTKHISNADKKIGEYARTLK
ncbi:MAG TPA: hemerythrin, partial [Clostridiales bacterium]|nr:hemerythrin [Clostridiales bacterium]